jgi:hypothetical protein
MTVDGEGGIARTAASVMSSVIHGFGKVFATFSKMRYPSK